MPASRDLRVGVRGDSSKLSPDLRKARTKFKKFGKDTGRDLKNSFGKVKGVIRSAVGLGGVVGFAALGRDVLDFEKKLTRLGIQANKNGRQMAGFRDQVNNVSSATGQSRDALLGAAAEFVSLTGDLDGASESLSLFGEVSAATGADLLDVARTAAALQKNLDIKTVDDMRAAFSGMAAQGKAGAVELRNLALLLPGLAPQMVLFKEKGIDALKSLGTNLQIVRKNFGTAEEAATGLRGLMTAIVKNSKRFEKGGVQIFEKGADGVKRLRDFNDIMRDIGTSKLAKDPALLAKAFGRAEALRAFLAISGASADEMERFTKAGNAATTIADDFNKFQKSSAGQIEKAWNDVKLTLLKLFTPGRVKDFSKAMERLVELVGFLVDNVEDLALAFASLKLGALVSGLASGGAAAAAAAKSLKKMAASAVLASAAFVGFKIGTELDKLLGLSDKIVENLLSIESLNRKAKAPSFITRGDRGLNVFGLPSNARKARGIDVGTIQQAKERGILTKAGALAPGARAKLKDIAALEAGIDPKDPEFGGGAVFAPRAEQLERRIQAAVQRQANRAPTAVLDPTNTNDAQRVDVNITIDPLGVLKAEAAISRRARRAVTE